ncbi:MAG TPA: O-antigen ligase family protein [Solirubrobacterales bacterium]|nr:O-antigen ligase family protein [Solirubrobacterales bacterium]
MEAGFAARSDAVSTADAWPHTRRPMPWLLAGFLVMIFLVPFEAIHLDVSLPVSSDLDRFVVAGLVAAFALGGLIGNRERIVRSRPRGWATGLIAFAFVTVASIAVNVDRITNLGEWEVAQKRLAVLAALIAFAVVVTLTLRVAELRKFAVLIAVLATITGSATIIEQRTGTNLFYDVATEVFDPIATVDPAPTSAVGVELGDRPMVVGPTRHALSVASMLGMALPFAVVLAAVAPSLRGRLLWVLAACVIVTATLITQRKSGAVVPAFALLALFVLRPRQLLRLAPVGIVALAIGLVLSGGAFNSVSGLLNSADADSTAGRTSDYPAVVPDLLSNPLLGRGYGTLDSSRGDIYRIFDNQYLGQLYQTGALGLMAFLALIITPLVVVRSVLRSDHPLRGPPALAAGAGCLAFGVSTALYDVLSFLGAPYLFLFLAAMCTCAASVEVLRPAPARAPSVRLPRHYQLTPEGLR